MVSPSPSEWGFLLGIVLVLVWSGIEWRYMALEGAGRAIGEDSYPMGAGMAGVAWLALDG